MALVDLIANSGAQNFERFRKGWLPTAEESQARRMADLNIQEKQQKVAYEPKRQRLKRESSEIDSNYKKSLMKQHEAEVQKFKTTAEKTKRDLMIKSAGRHYREAAKLDTVEKQKNYLFENQDEILPESVSQDKKEAFNKALSSDDKTFTNQFRSIRQGNKYLQDLNSKVFGQTVTYWNPNTNQVDQVAKDSPDYYAEVRRLKNDGYIASKKASLDLKGDIGKLGSKGTNKLDTKMRDRVDEEAAVTNTIKGYNEIINLVKKDTFRGGVVGDAIDGISDIYQQGKQLFGYGSILDKDGKIEWNQIKADKGVMAEIRKIAKTDARYAGALMEMAYMKAKSLDKGGRVTDADFRFARKMLAAGSDKGVIISLLNDNINRLESQFNTTSDIYNSSWGNGKTLFRSINTDKILGRGEFEAGNIAAQQQQQDSQALQERMSAITAKKEALYKKYPHLRNQP